LICGILGLTVFSLLAGVPAIILGHMARSRIAHSMGRLGGSGMALAGLIMGYISLAMIPLVLLALFAGPHFAQSWVPVNESGGAATIRQIVTAAESYYAMYPHRGYPERLSDLGGDGMAPNETDAGMLEETIASGGPKDGYVFYYEAFDSEGDGVLEDYFVRAEPQRPSSGARSFCSDSRGVVRSQAEGPCTVESAPAQ
jgi:hypothetical protein